jgi:hypothetical protein
MRQPHRHTDAPGRDSIALTALGPTVAAVLCVEDLPLGSAGGSRRAEVRWSDGTTGEALRRHPHEILICEGDLVGLIRAQLRSLQFRRDPRC